MLEKQNQKNMKTTKRKIFLYLAKHKTRSKYTQIERVRVRAKVKKSFI